MYSAWLEVEAIVRTKGGALLTTDFCSEVNVEKNSGTTTIADIEDIMREVDLTAEAVSEMQIDEGTNVGISTSLSSSWFSDDEDTYAALNEPLPLSSLCPGCFGCTPKPASAFISFDGNFQLKRFPTSKDHDDTYCEYRDRRLFINDEFTDIDDVRVHFITVLIIKANKKDSSPTTCSRNFKAASDATGNKETVDTGVMAAVCRCGVPLRLYNIRGTGERAIYVVRLLKNICKSKDCPENIKVLYDINCQFSKTIQIYLGDEEFKGKTMDFGIGKHKCISLLC